MGIEIEDDAVKMVFDDSGGHPRLARLLSSAAYKHREGKVTITKEDYLKGVDWLQEEDGGIDDFIRENVWMHVSELERKVLGFCSSKEGIKSAVIDSNNNSESNIHTTQVELSEFEPVEFGTLKEARQHLLATGVLETLDNQSIRAKGNLLREWIRNNDLTS